MVYLWLLLYFDIPDLRPSHTPPTFSSSSSKNGFRTRVRASKFVLENMPPDPPVCLWTLCARLSPHIHGDALFGSLTKTLLSPKYLWTVINLGYYIILLFKATLPSLKQLGLWSVLWWVTLQLSRLCTGRINTESLFACTRSNLSDSWLLPARSVLR